VFAGLVLMLGFCVVIFGLCLLFTRDFLRLMDSRTHSLAEVTEPFILSGFFAGMGGRRGRIRDRASESVAPMTLTMAASILAPVTLRSLRPAMTTAATMAAATPTA
jgi:hypothetical protein